VLGAAPKTLIEFTKIIGDLLMNWNPLFYLTLTSNTSKYKNSLCYTHKELLYWFAYKIQIN
ncbi:MAG: hypothetical protein ACOX8G_09045, partial [Eubacterium sp.]